MEEQEEDLAEDLRLGDTEGLSEGRSKDLREKLDELRERLGGAPYFDVGDQFEEEERRGSGYKRYFFEEHLSRRIRHRWCQNEVEAR